MSSVWKPDDTFLDQERNPGKDAVDTALKNHHLSLDRILTSRDLEMDQVRYELRRAQMPPGWQSWQLPVYLLGRPTFAFLQTGEPGAVLPEHSHKVDQFRIVVSGGVIFNGVELKTGDWIYIPKDHAYGLSASLNPGCSMEYFY